MADLERTRNKQKRVSLVTGGTSSLGIHVIRRLLKRGDEVRAIIRQHPTADDSWKVLPPGCIPYVADFTFRSEKDKETLIEACRGVTEIYHIGGAIFNSKHKYNQLVNINVIGTENLLRAYLYANPENGSKATFMYASSVTVYGYNRRNETLSEDADTKPASGYAESKMMAEKVIQSFQTANPRLPYTIFRIGNLYGPGYESEFFKIFRLIREKKISFLGKGENHLTLAHVEDVADAMLLASENPKAMNKVYNVTDGVPHTMKELFTKAAKFMNVPAPTKGVNAILARIGASTRGINTDEFDFMASDRIVSIDRARRELGYKPTRSIDVDGKLMVDDFMKKFGN
ncbi:MAG: NAD(P)-dependent oxidoreductase [Candidatus Micrarchaeota archaeon]|nr:NAD(P)-dependent oxidoreductase [Candidatus Micrarchaeota archaeon]